jgi:hypothetical protein
MRITLIGKYNPSFIQYYKNKGLNEDDLIENGDALINDALYVLKTELTTLGHEVQLLIIGLENDQRLFEKAKEFNPNIIHIGSYFEYYGTLLKEMKSSTKATVTTWINRPLIEDLNLSQIDMVFTGRPFYVDHFKSLGVEAEEAIVGFPNNYSLSNEKTIDVGFIGAIDGLFTKIKYHNKRTDLVKYLSNHIGLHKWGYGFLSDPGIKTTVKKLINGKKLYENFHGEVWGEDMFKVLNSFKISINCHAEIAGDYAVNNRMFETTGAKTLLVTDHQKYLNKYFEPDTEVITYKSKEECLEKIQYLLSHPDELNAITLAGYKKTLENYTVKHFSEKYAAIIEELRN